MAREQHVFSAENNEIPRGALTFEGFHRWVESAAFPETGRIDFLDGQVEVELSPEELFSHGLVKGAIHAGLHELLAESEIGEVFTDSARYTSRTAGLSAEPDVIVVLDESLQSGRVRYVSTGGRPGRFSEIEGAADLVVEVVSDSSVDKDTRRLPRLYALAGVPELWIADARGSDLQFQAYALRGESYVRIEPDADGWIGSERLGYLFRLTRRRTSRGTWRYSLERQRG